MKQYVLNNLLEQLHAWVTTQICHEHFTFSLDSGTFCNPLKGKDNFS